VAVLRLSRQILHYYVHGVNIGNVHTVHFDPEDGQGLTDSKAGYHHGDLRTALIDAGLQLTRAGGPEALTIREATRRVGVSPNAAYRHFADREALLQAVAIAIQHRMTARMRASVRRRGPAELLRAVGIGYIKFALDEPGWFAVAFFGGARSDQTASAPPYLALVGALDAMAGAGALSPERRDGAEWPCWSAVHGFAELALHGPLRRANRRELDSLAQRTVDDIIAGLSRRA
jgi:AcrR family transcriptional regulator